VDPPGFVGTVDEIEMDVGAPCEFLHFVVPVVQR
jgi:hypothetical protein